MLLERLRRRCSPNWLCTNHLKPPHPPIWAWAGHSLYMQSESEWSPWFPGIKVSGAFPRPYCSTHSTPFVKQLIIAKCNTPVKRHCWQPWNKQIDLWAASKKLAKAAQCPMSMSKYLYVEVVSLILDRDFERIPRLQGNQNIVYMRCKSPRSPAKARIGGVRGFQMTGALWWINDFLLFPHFDS